MSMIYQINAEFHNDLLPNGIQYDYVHNMYHNAVILSIEYSQLCLSYLIPW